MSLLRIVFKSLRQHLLSTCITAFSIALAAGLLMSVWVVREQSRRSFTQMDSGFDAVVGIRSSQLQLVMNAIFHLENSPGNIEVEDYEKIKAEPGVALAVPIALGDNFKGYRIVGTIPEMFTHNEYAPGKKYKTAEGRLFDPELREAVVGSFVAQKLNLKVGDEFEPYHGLDFDEDHAHDETYVIVGVLEPSNTPADRLIWIPVEGLQFMSGHREESHEELSAVLVKFRSPLAGKTLQMKYNQPDGHLTMAWPIGAIVAQLFDKISWFDRILEMLAYLVAVVATGSILASIYNSMNERRREIAIMRALGARRSTIFSSVVLESASIAAIGVVVGFSIYLLITTTAAQFIRAQTGMVIDPMEFHNVMLFGPIGIVLAAALAGVIPAMKAYNTDVAQNLVPVS
ncbi:MAG: ABC transporter permease [Verrucomicrobia bacterium]|nr:ABC transporter permease [Verrucomicrobiota bacterium]